MVPARYFIYLGFILFPFANLVSVVVWALDPAANPAANRPEYPIANCLMVSGLALVLIAPWFLPHRFGTRFAIWALTLVAFLIYLIPLYLLWISTGVYIRS